MLLNRGGSHGRSGDSFTQSLGVKLAVRRSAEVIVPCEDSAREGLNPTEVNIVRHHQMEGRMQKISSQNDSRPQKNRRKAKGYEGCKTFHVRGGRIFHTNNLKREYPLLEQILVTGNLNAAYKQVKATGGRAGDKIKWIATDCSAISEARRQLTKYSPRTYASEPVRRLRYPGRNAINPAWDNRL